MVRLWRQHVAARVFAPFFEKAAAGFPEFYSGNFQSEDALWPLVQEQPDRLLNPAHTTWNSLLLAAADDVIADADHGLAPARLTNGQENTLSMQHPFSRFLPKMLASLLNMPAQPLPGGSDMPRIQSGHCRGQRTALGTHFSPLADLGMVNSAAHALELLLFVVGGVIYYYPLMSGNPQPNEVPHSVRVISLFAMMVPETMVGFFLYASSQMLHDTGMPAMGAPSALTDQHIGGALMWSMGMIIDSVWVVLAVTDFLANERQRSESLV